MVEQVLAAVVALALGGFAIAAWWFAMFSDSDWGGVRGVSRTGGVFLSVSR